MRKTPWPTGRLIVTLHEGESPGIQQIHGAFTAKAIQYIDSDFFNMGELGESEDLREIFPYGEGVYELTVRENFVPLGDCDSPWFSYELTGFVEFQSSTDNDD